MPPSLPCAVLGADGEGPGLTFPPVFQMVGLSLLLPLANTALGQCPGAGGQAGGCRKGVTAASWPGVPRSFSGPWGLVGSLWEGMSLCVTLYRQEDAHCAWASSAWSMAIPALAGVLEAAASLGLGRECSSQGKKNSISKIFPYTQRTGGVCHAREQGKRFSHKLARLSDAPRAGAPPEPG